MTGGGDSERILDRDMLCEENLLLSIFRLQLLFVYKLNSSALECCSSSLYLSIYQPH